MFRCPDTMPEAISSHGIVENQGAQEVFASEPDSSRTAAYLSALNPAGDRFQIDKGRFVARSIDHVADQVDGLEVRVGGEQARGVGQKVEHGAVADRPVDGQLEGLADSRAGSSEQYGSNECR